MPFCTKEFCAAFHSLQLGFVIFWRKKIGAKADCRMLINLTTAGKYFLITMMMIK